MVNINNLVQSILDHRNCFRTITGLEPCMEEGRPVFRSGRIHSDFEMSDGEGKVIARCFLRRDREKYEKMCGLSYFLAPLDEPVYGRFSFHPGELLVFGDNGEYTYADVALIGYPQGRSLAGYAEKCLDGSSREGAEDLMDILRQLAAFAGRHNRHKVCMGGIRPENFRVTESGRIVLTGLENAARGESDDDISGIAALFCILYLGFSDSRAASLSGNGNQCRRVLKSCVSDGSLPDSFKELCSLLTAFYETEPSDSSIAVEVIQKMDGTVKTGIVVSEYLPALLDKLDLGMEAVRIVNRTKYEYVGPMSCMLMRAFDGGRWCYLDKHGNVAIAGPFIDAGDFWEGQARVEVSTEKMGVIDTEGNFIVPPEYADVELDQTGNRIIVTKDGQSALMLRSGEMLTGFDYDHIGSQSEGIHTVWKNDRLGYITRDGGKLTDIIYEDGESFSKGTAEVKLRGRRYLIGTDGKIIDDIL